MASRTTSRARSLRNAPTDAERLLWRHLRGEQMHGLKFRRQHPVGPYFADFACLTIKLIVELDGGQHANQKDHDRQRDDYLATHGYKVLRYWDNDVLARTVDVLADIWQQAEARLNQD